MPSLDNPFRKHTTPPAKDALRALGVDTSGMADAKPTDPGMVLTDADRERIRAIEAKAEAKKDVWNRARLIEWAQTFGQDSVWVDEMFEIRGDKIVCTQDVLDLHDDARVSEIPPGLQVERLHLSYTPVSVIPPGLQVKELDLLRTQVKEIPPGLQMKKLSLSNTQVSQIPAGLQVKDLFLHNTLVTEIPEGTAIKKIWCARNQTSLISSAKAKGIEVAID